MATLIQDIRSRSWQISTLGVGVIAEGLEDVRQCLDIILRTAKGSCPLRPQFGSDIYRYADAPQNIAIPNIRRAILEAVEIWETRVTLVSITHEITGAGSVAFNIIYSLNDSEQTDTLSLFLQGGYFNTSIQNLGGLVVNAFFPPNPATRRYVIELQQNGTQALPFVPAGGFGSLSDMFAWVQDNWSGYGHWHLLADRITGYLRADLFDTAAVSISLIGTLRFDATIPMTTAPDGLTVALVANGITVTPVPATPLPTMGDLLSWVQAHWAQYGTWALEGVSQLPGEFSSEFSDEFFTATPASYKLVLLTDSLNTATLTVSVA